VVPRGPSSGPASVEEIEMAMQAPTRITIEVHTPEPGAGSEQPVVRVVPEAHPGGSTQLAAAEPREDMPAPAAYEPGPCLCLDDEDCAADHANE
jgi:hypothetical protein